MAARVLFTAGFSRRYITVRLPEDLLNRARRKAAAENGTRTSLIEDGLRVVVGKNRKTEKRKTVMPRISKAGGGLMPAVDLTNPSTLQAADDLDYIRRIQRSEWLCRTYARFPDLKRQAPAAR